MTGFLPKQKQRHISDYIDIYCSHAKDCEYSKCPYMPIENITVDMSSDMVAYTDDIRCDNYRTSEDGIIGGMMIEVGIWKTDAGIVSAS